MNNELKSALKSFLDRLIEHSQTCVIPAELYEGDADTLRDAIAYVDHNERQAIAQTAPAVAGEAIPNDELPPADPSIVPINKVLDLINKAIGCGNKPMPDPIAHSHEAYARALHNVFCDMRFKLFEVRSILLDCAAPSQGAKQND